MINEAGITKFTIGMLSVVGYVCLLIGTQIFNSCLKKYEYRRLIFASTVITLVCAPLTIIFTLRLNVEWGVPDLSLILFSDIVSGVISTCLVLLPSLVLCAKICPKHIEATSFATLAGISNFT